MMDEAKKYIDKAEHALLVAEELRKSSAFLGFEVPAHFLKILVGIFVLNNINNIKVIEEVCSPHAWG